MRNALPPTGCCPTCWQPVETDERLLIDLQTNTGVIDGTPFNLKPREMEVLFALHDNFPYAVSAERMLQLIGGFNQDINYASLKVYVSRIRSALEATGLRIASGWGQGWRLVLPPARGPGQAGREDDG